jgi:CBS domain-containing protein
MSAHSRSVVTTTVSKGMVTDRDIVITCVAEGGDPQATRAGDLDTGKPVTIGADDSIEEILTTMKQHKVRRAAVGSLLGVSRLL